MAARLRRILTSELRLLGAVGRALLRRPIASSAITFTRNSTYPSVALALGIVIVVEGLALHLLLPVHRAARLALLAAHMLSLLWLVGDLRALRESTCRFERAAVDVRLGFRGAVRIPFHLIADASSDEHATDEANVFRLTPGDAPNVTLDLCKPIIARGPLGIRRRAKTVRLYVDDPAAFLTLLRSQPRRRRSSSFASVGRCAR